jgi:peptidyl-tRNA hydrolase
MNRSGRSVSKAYSKVGAESWGALCVIHDELEFPVGEVNFRKMGQAR